MECAKCRKTEALPATQASTYKNISKALYLLNLSSVMFNNSVVDHNGSPSLTYVLFSLSSKSSKCITSSLSISSSSNSKSSSSSGSTSLSPNSTFLEELDLSVYFLIVCPPFNEIVHHCHVLLCPS